MPLRVSLLACAILVKVVALQINDDQLPSSFNDAIVASINMNQKISQAHQDKENAKVTLKTQLNTAELTAQATVAQAKGTAEVRLCGGISY